MPFRNVLLFVLALVSGGASAHALTVTPVNPTAGEELLLSIEMLFGSGPKSLVSTEVRVEGVQIIVTAVITGPDFAAGGSAYAAVATPGLEPAAYEVYLNVRQALGNGSVPVSGPDFLGRIFVAPGSAATPAHTGLNGNWFDTASPGWGANIVQGVSRTLFIGWFDYEARPGTDPAFSDAQDNTWRVLASGKWVTPTQFRGVLYTTQGTPVNLPWLPASLQVTAVGHLTITFASATEALFEGNSFVPPVGAQAFPQPFQRRANIRRFGF